MTVVTDQSHTRFLAITHRTDVDEWRAMLARKSAVARYFRELDEAAENPKPRRVPKPVQVKAPPKPRPSRARGPRPYQPEARPCPVCGCDTRPDSAKAAAVFPGMQPRKSKGRCLRCYKKSQRKTNRDPRRVRPCVKCGHLTRPAKTPIAKFPGTIQRQTADTCQTCYRRERRTAA